jgi:hypothetical protein
VSDDTPVRLDIVILPLPKRIEGRYLGVVFGVLAGVLGSFLVRPSSLDRLPRTTLEGWLRSVGEDPNVLAFVVACAAITAVAGFVIGYVLDLCNSRGISKLNEELKELERQFYRLQRQNPQPVSELRAVLDRIAIVDHEHRKITGWTPPRVYRATFFWALMLPSVQLLVLLMAQLLKEGTDNGIAPALSELGAAFQSSGSIAWHAAWMVIGGMLGWAYCELEKRKLQVENRYLAILVTATHLMLFLLGQAGAVLSAFLASVLLGIAIGSPFTWIVLGGAAAAAAPLAAKKKGLL